MPVEIGEIRISPPRLCNLLPGWPEPGDVIHDHMDITGRKTPYLFHHLGIGISPLSHLDPSELAHQVIIVLALDQWNMLFAVPLAVIAMAFRTLFLVQLSAIIQIPARPHGVMRRHGQL